MEFIQLVISFLRLLIHVMVSLIPHGENQLLKRLRQIVEILSIKVFI